MPIKRTIKPAIIRSLFKGKVVILYGARQVGKTTLAREIQSLYKDEAAYFNCDEPDVREAFTEKTSTQMKAFAGGRKLLILDEAQRVPNIGRALKLFHDSFPDIQLLATGSSSFELSDKVSEPLTGRKTEFTLYPFSMEELESRYPGPEAGRLLERRLIYGMYPEIALKSGDPSGELKSLARSYAYKDVLTHHKIKNHEVLEKLLQALALQIGSEVSYNELASLLGVDKNTAASYIQILEKAFIVFRLGPFSRNLRNELKKLRKIYFYDTGLRNALINNLNPMALRQDTGALWENFLVAERLKGLANHGIDRRLYFWRTQQKQEIDLLEVEGEAIRAFEIKWGKVRSRPPKAFSDAYPGAVYAGINRGNYPGFIHPAGDSPDPEAGA
ncbi:MAG: putative AAA+ superfamily ATPase [Elusimicrobia bacterium]|nr:MAG: putative AAA+ superfamily ATPase [Elusimicrobiota bacterium]KAF0155566.1 MAG: putative AAA+ superfamily ATPase [Elusimicrobiota bacterium]